MTLPDIVLIVCGNDNGWHNENEYFPRYLIHERVMIDDPTREQMEELFDKFPDTPIMVVVSPCTLCRATGFKGKRGGFVVKRTKKGDG